VATKKTTTRRTKTKPTTKRTPIKRTTEAKEVPPEAVISEPSSQERIARLNELWGSRSGLIGWLSAVNHKNIGARYIVTGFLFFAMAGIAALLMRTQLAVPENNFLDPNQ
jgi:hypothetical protein